MGNCVPLRFENCMRSVMKKNMCRKKRRRSIVLLVVGLDNAGKSAIVNYLYNKSLLTKETVVPTIGFRTVTFNYKSISIRLFDIGGGPQIRALWPKYYSDVHGVIYVVDANDAERLSESTAVFQDLACHELISQKPILFLGNKQDLFEALDEIEIIELMNIEQVANYTRCYTRVEICSCYPDKNRRFNLNKNIDKGFKWLVEEINSNYNSLEDELALRKEKQKARRSHSLKTWAPTQIHNSFDYPDSDSDVCLKPIVPKINKVNGRRKTKRSLRPGICWTNNRTAPLPIPADDDDRPTSRTMKDLIRNMKIEDLINNTKIDENLVSEYQRPRIRRKRRPKSAPAAVRLFELKPI